MHTAGGARGRGEGLELFAAGVHCTPRCPPPDSLGGAYLGVTSPLDTIKGGCGLRVLLLRRSCFQIVPRLFNSDPKASGEQKRRVLTLSGTSNIHPLYTRHIFFSKSVLVKLILSVIYGSGCLLYSILISFWQMEWLTCTSCGVARVDWREDRVPAKCSRHFWVKFSFFTIFTKKQQNKLNLFS